jgi:hypothetical protein
MMMLKMGSLNILTAIWTRDRNLRTFFNKVRFKVRSFDLRSIAITTLEKGGFMD